MLNRFIMIAGILILVPCLNNSVHDSAQEKLDPVPSRILGLLRSRSPTQQIRGFVELSEFKGDLKKAVPSIEKGLRSENIGVRQATEYMLSRSDTRLLASLEPLLKSDDFEKYRFGCDMAFSIGEPAAKYVHVVESKMNRKDFGASENAFTMASLLALRGMGPKAQPALPAIIKSLNSSHLHVVLFACKTVIAMGPAGKQASEKLIDIVQNGNASTRGWAGQALAMLGTSEKYDVVKILAPRLEAYNTLERERVLEGIAHLGPVAKSQQKIIGELMREKKFHTQPFAAMAYHKVTGESKEPVEILMGLTKDLNTREQAIEMLGRIGPDASAAVDTLIEFANMDPEEITLREKAVIALGQVGPKAKKAIPMLEEIVRKELDWLLRQRAINSIEQIRSKKSAKPKPVGQKVG